MQNDLSQHVLEVMAYGLSLKERVTNGEMLLLDSENAKLKQMLWADGAVRGHVDYGDNLPRPVPYDSREFLGARYALACWLDEIFISDTDSPWMEQWKEKSLEAEIYGGGQERAWRFWSQAELAEKRPGTEAVETYLWCVMLGFRGAPRIIDPKEWTERVKRRVLGARKVEFRLPADLGLKTNVPALRSRDSFRTAARLLMVVAAFAMLFVAMLITQKINNE